MTGAGTEGQGSLGSVLNRTLDGDREAMRILLATLRPYLHLLVRQAQATGTRAGPDDSSLVQETLMRLHRGLDPIDPAGTAAFKGGNVPRFLAWVRQIVRNVVLDRIRHDRAAMRDHGREVPGSKVFPLVDGGGSPAEQAERAEDALRLAAALERLPEHQRELIRLRVFEQHSFEEIAEQTGKTAGALRVAFKRAIERLQQDNQLRRDLGRISS
jgi:RNA polymerase sigma-70 factor, ECF subfamily